MREQHRGSRLKGGAKLENSLTGKGDIMDLKKIYTFAEASELWGLSESTLRRAQRSGRFKEGETKKSGGTWIVTRAAMERLYGEEPEKTLKKGGIKMTRTKWQDVLEHAKYFAENDYLQGIEPGSWEKKNAMRDLEDHLRLNSIWTKYEGTDEEDEVMKYFIEEYNKELKKLWNEA